MSEGVILAGDIGGTKSILAICRGSPDRPEILAERTYRNQEFSGLREVIDRFRADTGLNARRACFGVAGAVVDGMADLPNLGWHLSEHGLMLDLKFAAVRLVNDLEANALGLATLKQEHLFSLNRGRPRHGGNRALIAAGTGLGMAILFEDRADWRVAASEGGHMDFAPRGEMQNALLRFLAKRYGHVSIERVVSGQGLANIFDFLAAEGMQVPDPLASRLATTPDHAPLLGECGLRGDEPICVKALDIFLSAYGAAAGNLALVALATGGIYLGGGIAPKLIDALSESGFMPAFKDKGRFANLLADIPVHVVLEPRTALLGAARSALLKPSEQ